MPAPRKQSPNSPATSSPPPPGQAITRAQALRWWQAGYQAGRQAAEDQQQASARWDHLVASFRAQHAADQQARIEAQLLETIHALATLFTSEN
jgi:flagellar biosynthesis/type III secretory pathway protein FliH